MNEQTTHAITSQFDDVISRRQEEASSSILFHVNLPKNQWFTDWFIRTPWNEVSRAFSQTWQPEARWYAGKGSRCRQRRDVGFLSNCRWGEKL